MQNLKSKRIVFGAIFAVALILIAVSSRAQAQPSSINVQTTAVATTTLTYLASGATTTYQIDSYPTYSSSNVFSMAGIDSEYLYVQATASSTATLYTFTPQFSNNGTDWYGMGSQGTASAAGSIAVSTTTTFTWTPGATTFTSMAFKLPDMTGMHERVLTTVSGAAGAVYEEVVLKKNAQGQ